MMDDFLLKWQLCCVSAILIQHKCTGRLLWLFNSYHCGKLISNLWRAISGWKGTFGLLLSFSSPPFFFSFPFCKPNERCSLKFPRHLPQAAREQRAELCSPCSSKLPAPVVGAHLGEQSRGTRASQQFPSHHCLCPGVPWKLKYPSSMQCLVYLLPVPAVVKNAHPNYHWARIQYPAVFCFKNTQLGFSRERGQPTSTTRDWYSCNTNTPSMLPCRKKAAQKLLHDWNKNYFKFLAWSYKLCTTICFKRQADQ